MLGPGSAPDPRDRILRGKEVQLSRVLDQAPGGQERGLGEVPPPHGKIHAK